MMRRFIQSVSCALVALVALAPAFAGAQGAAVAPVVPAPAPEIFLRAPVSGATVG